MTARPRGGADRHPLDRVARTGQQRLEQLGGLVGAQQDDGEHRRHARPPAHQRDDDRQRRQEHVLVGAAQVRDERGQAIQPRAGEIDEPVQDRRVGRADRRDVVGGVPDGGQKYDPGRRPDQCRPGASGHGQSVAVPTPPYLRMRSVQRRGSVRRPSRPRHRGAPRASPTSGAGPLGVGLGRGPGRGVARDAELGSGAGAAHVREVLEVLGRGDLDGDTVGDLEPVGLVEELLVAGRPGRWVRLPPRAGDRRSGPPRRGLPSPRRRGRTRRSAASSAGRGPACRASA